MPTLPQHWSPLVTGMPPGDSQMAGRRPEVAFQGVNQCSRASGPKPRPGPGTPKVLKRVASFVRKATSCPRHMFDMALGHCMQVGHGGAGFNSTGRD